MQARTVAMVGPGGALTSVSCQAPLTLRQVYSEDRDVCALCLVGTAAGPLRGDLLELDLTISDGARATLQASGASIAQGAGDGTASLSTTARVGTGSSLRAQPGAVVVAAGANVEVSVDLDLSADAHVEWRELIVLGRSDEERGSASLRWNVTRAGRTVLRQHVDLTDPALTAWPGMLAGGRVVASAFISGPEVVALTHVASDTAVIAQLDDHTVLATVLGTDAAAVTADLDSLCTQVHRQETPAETPR